MRFAYLLCVIMKIIALTFGYNKYTGNSVQLPVISIDIGKYIKLFF